MSFFSVSFFATAKHTAMCFAVLCFAVDKSVLTVCVVCVVRVAVGGTWQTTLKSSWRPIASA